MKSPPFILVDGSSYLYRAFHAMPNLSNSSKEPTGAISGMVNMLSRLLDEYNPEHVAIVFDAKGSTFRNDMYPEYKANRSPMPPELRLQIEPIHELVEAMGFPMLVVPGVEADDVIGTLARQASAAGRETVISTGDKDMAQLVDEHVWLVNTMDDSEMDRDGVIKKFGVPPDRIIDYLALIGDKVDNVPGVPKCGPKTAVKWLESYGSFAGVLEHADEIKGKVGENLRDSLSFLPLSYELVTIKCDVELDKKPDELLMQAPDAEKLKALFLRYELKTRLKKLLKDAGETVVEEPETKVEYETIFEESVLDEWITLLKEAEVFAFDTETTSLDYMQADLVGVSFAIEGRAAYLPLTHDYPGAPVQLNKDHVLALLKPLLEDPAQAKVGQNLKYDKSVLARAGITLKGIQFDTMLESYVLDSTASRHDMDSLALKYLGRKTIHFEDIAGKGKKQITFNQVAIEDAAPYAAEDTEVTLALHNVLWSKLVQSEKQKEIFENIELPLLSVLSRIERNGVCVDGDMLRSQSGEIAKRLYELEQKAFELAGQPFNLGSPKQLQTILFENMKLPVISKTPKGQPSTAEPVLQELAHDYPLPKLILETRSLSKLKSTYTDTLPEQIDSISGRVHTSYHQAVAATGRLSSSNPNLQNIPIRSAEGRRIRQAFIAPDGYRLLAADYSQIELRIMAHLSGDTGLVNAFAAGEDIHRATAAEVFATDVDAVSVEQRRSAKAINFGLIYGMSAFGLAKQLEIGRNDAQNYIDLYFSRYPGVKLFMDETREKAHENGYVETVFGRRLYLPEINSSNGQRRQYAERTAINAPMQGTAADIIKLAMLATDDWISRSDIDIRMIMQVHDELVFEIATEHVADAREQINKLMTEATVLNVPLVVDIGEGANWDEAH